MTRLSVNLNKIAVLRNSRGGALPSVRDAADVVLGVGARGLTVHPRPDQRHIRAEDVQVLARLLAHRAASLPAAERVEFNIEGNPFAPAAPSRPHGASSAYPGLLELVRAARPEQVTFVPDGDHQITSDHGFDLGQPQPKLRDLIAQYRALGARVSLFVDADSRHIARAAEYGAERIEIYTGPFAAAVQLGDYQAALDDCVRVAEQARAAGLALNAGHDLDLHNLPILRAAIPDIAEVSIGHALINHALYSGLAATVSAYLRACAESD